MTAPPANPGSDYEDAFDAGLFISEAYQPAPFFFGRRGDAQGDEEENENGATDKADKAATVAITLLALPSATTAHDLTGQVPWPAARILGDYLVAAGAATVAAAGSALELGAGLGVAGAAAALAGARRLHLTDGEPVVLRVLQKNAALIAAATGAEASVSGLDWGSAADVAAAVALAPAGWPLVLGADVAYSVKALPALFSVVAALLRGQRGEGKGVALVGYCSRSLLLDRGLPVAAAEAGLTCVEVPGTRGRARGLEGWVVRCALR